MFLHLANKLYDNFNYDKTFLLCKRIKLASKVRYLYLKYITLLGQTREIVYLDSTFRYDNRFTPILLQSYPKEIEELDEAINLKRISSVLDIGANIGQWSFTLKSFFPHIDVVSFEPNPKIFRLLKNNSKPFRKWKSFNIGIGDPTRHKYLYYSGDRSAEASVFKSNNTQGVGIKLVQLNLENLKKYRLMKEYDLVKIDVEGAEIEVLESIKNIRFKYLTVEIAIQRSKGVSIRGVENTLKNLGLKPKLVFSQKVNSESQAGNVLFSF